MKAVICEQTGDEDVLQIGEVVAPDPGPDEVRITVHAAALNRADILQRRGHYPPPPGASTILGLDCSGVVRDVGANVTRWRPGERVMALLTGGGYAEEAVAHAGSVMPLPRSYSFEEAAAVPEVFLTAFLNIFMLGEPPPGGVVLVHGGGSGVGTAAISLCREAGLKIFVTAGSDEKCDRCRDHGATLAINYRTQSFADVVRDATKNGVNVILDPIGAQYLERNLACLAPDGRLVAIGSMGGVRRAEIDFPMLLGRRLRVIGSTLRNRPVLEKTAIVNAFLARFGEAMDAGRVKPVVDSVFPLEKVRDAHRRMQSSAHFGKIVLKVRE